MPAAAPGRAPRPRTARRWRCTHCSTSCAARHPGVEWESCAAGGGRIDLGMLERVQRVWTSDMTDALARQSIQRWTGQLVPPEYLGAHVSAPFSHQTGRYMPMSLRCATALFGHFGIEADITQASADEDGRARRLDPALQAASRSDPLRPCRPDRHPGRHRVDAWRRRSGPGSGADVLRAARRAPQRSARRPAGTGTGPSPALPGHGRDPGRAPAPVQRADGPRMAGLEVSGAALAEIGLFIPAQRTLSAPSFSLRRSDRLIRVLWPWRPLGHDDQPHQKTQD